MGLGVVGLEPDGRAVARRSASAGLALVGQDVAEVGVGLGEVGPEPERGAVLGLGLRRLALVVQGVAEVAVGPGVVGLEPGRGACGRHGRIQRRRGFLRPAVVLEPPAQAAQVPGMLGRGRPRLAQLAEDRPGLLGAAAALQQVGQRVTARRLQGARDAVAGDGLGPALGRQLGQVVPQPLVEPGVARVAKQAAAEHRHGAGEVAGYLRFAERGGQQRHGRRPVAGPERG